MAELWVSVEDLAKHLGIAKDSVYRWMERKGLPARRLGRLTMATATSAPSRRPGRDVPEEVRTHDSKAPDP